MAQVYNPYKLIAAKAKIRAIIKREPLPTNLEQLCKVLDLAVSRLEEGRNFYSCVAVTQAAYWVLPTDIESTPVIGWYETNFSEIVLECAGWYADVGHVLGTKPHTIRVELLSYICERVRTMP